MIKQQNKKWVFLKLAFYIPAFILTLSFFTLSTLPANAGLCGPAQDGTFTTPEALNKTVDKGLGCSDNAQQTGVSIVGNKYQWKCWTSSRQRVQEETTCSANKDESGICGYMHGQTLTGRPPFIQYGQGQCIYGEPSQISGNGPWTWTCTYGKPVTCTAYKAPSEQRSNPSPLCGPAQDGTFTTPEALNKTVDKGLGCSDNAQQTGVSIVGNKYQWKCWTSSRQRVQEETTCSANKDESGICGYMHGQTLTGRPPFIPNGQGQCIYGEPSQISGNGPWTWTCTYGKPVTCTAYTAGGQSAPDQPSPACGANNGKNFSGSGPDQRNNCTSGAVVGISGTEPAGVDNYALYNGNEWVGWDWTCGGSGRCFACLQGFTAQNGTCVKNQGGNTNQTPSQNPNPSQNPTPTQGGACGSANGKDFTSQPSANLCSSGTATGIEYEEICFSPGGPGGRCAHWSWRCGSTSCSAWDTRELNKKPNTTSEPEVPTSVSGDENTLKVSGSCGNAAKNYTASESSFTGSLCYTGIPDPITMGFPMVDGSTSWKCKGMSGGQDSTLCVATRGNTNLSQSCQKYNSSADNVMDGYSSPFNQVSQEKEAILTTTCSTSGTTVNAGSSNTYTFKTGFVSENGVWRKIDFTGTEASKNQGWIKGVATASLDAPSSQEKYVIAFICQYQNGKWMCGCKDRTCGQSYWTLQAFKK